MKRLNLFLFAIFATILSAAVFAQTDESIVKKMKIAVIWNEDTDNSDVPWGWNVGGKSEHYPEDVQDAPEIAKAQLKFYLSSIGYTGYDFSKTLDSDVMEEGWGGNINPELENVYIYTTYSVDSYNRIKNDFGGVKPNAIIYIGAGAEIGDEVKQKVFKLMEDAAKDNVGILLIGSKSAVDAKELDKEKETFPVMGVQKPFYLKAWVPDGTDVLKEFNFLSKNDTQEWEIADTVTIYGDYEGHIQLRLGEREPKGELIYDNKSNGGNTALTRDNIMNAWVHNDFIRTFTYKNENGTETRDTTKIIGAYGEASIYAKAVEVIDVDEYPTEMNFGVHREPDFEVVAENGKVYIMGRSWNPGLTINGREIIKKSSELTGANGLQGSMSGNYFVVSQDWFLEEENPENNNKKDKILVIRQGTRIKQSTLGRNNDDSEDGTYIDQFSAGGFLDLRINLGKFKDSKIFKDIFTHHELKNKEDLYFKPWSVGGKYADGGRIKADADIWAFNEKLKLRSFDELSASNARFDQSAYYCDYLGDQMAGKPNGAKQFMRPPLNLAEFDVSYDRRIESELPATNSTNTNYYKNFKGKLFHAISAVQHGSRRLAMVGYQPTFLMDMMASRAILHDITKWIGYNQYQLLGPDIKVALENGDTVAAHEQYIKTTEGPIIVEFNGSNMTDEMRKYEHTLKAKLTYGNTTIPVKSANISVDETGKVVIEFYLENDITINPNNENDTTITVVAWPEGNRESIFSTDENDTTKATIKLKKLDTKVTINNNDNITDGRETTSKDTLVITAVWDKDKNPVTDEEITVTVKSKDKTETITVKNGDKILFKDLPEGDLTIEITAKANGYVNSNTKTLKVNNNLDKPYIVTAVWDWGCSRGADYDVLTVTYNGEIEHDFNANNSNGSDIFYMYDGGVVKKIYVKSPQDKGANKYEYTVVKVEDNYLPSTTKEGYEININSEWNVINNSSRNKADADNKKSTLYIERKNCYNPTVTVVPGGKIPTTGGDTINIGSKINPKEENPVVKEVLDNGNGTIIIIDTGSDVDAETLRNTRIHAIILDAVGNMVVETSDNEKSEHLGIVVSTMGGSDKNVLTIAWDNKNTLGRDVGAGVYVLLIETEWEDNLDVFRDRKMLPVPQKKTKTIEK